VSRPRLEVEVASGNAAARRVLDMRVDSNLLLTTILWGNVGINVLLTMLSESVLAGVAAFAFSTVFITAFGEILPQAYFSRNALSMASRLAPVLRFYQFVLYPVVKPSALLLDAWLGEEGISYFREQELKEILRLHMLAEESDVSRGEAIGALNFLTIDDLPIASEGADVDPASIIRLPARNGQPVFPPFENQPDDPFLKQVEASGKPWIVITDEGGEPLTLLDADGFLRHAVYHSARTDPAAFCHRPVVIREPDTPLGEAIEKLRFDPHAPDLISRDTILLWTKERRVITGSDLLGRLLRGVVKRGHLRATGETGAAAGASPDQAG
jgi:metal transporter CNNM